MHVLWSWLKEDDAGSRQSPTPSGQCLKGGRRCALPLSQSTREMSAPWVMRGFPQITQRGSSSYRKLDLYVTHSAKGQLTGKSQVIWGWGWRGWENRGAGLRQGCPSWDWHKGSTAEVMAETSKTHWGEHHFPSCKRSTLSQLQASPRNVQQSQTLEFHTSLLEGILTKQSQHKHKTISCIIEILPSALKLEAEHHQQSNEWAPHVCL